MLSPNTHFFLLLSTKPFGTFFLPSFLFNFRRIVFSIHFFSVLISSQSSLYFSMFFSLLSLLFFCVLSSTSVSVFVFAQPTSSTFDKRLSAWWACAPFKWFLFAIDAFVLAYYLSDLSMFMACCVRVCFFTLLYWIDRQNWTIHSYSFPSLLSLIAMRCVFDDCFFCTFFFLPTWFHHKEMLFGARFWASRLRIYIWNGVQSYRLATTNKTTIHISCVLYKHNTKRSNWQLQNI